jgi:membrane protease YdiL (CAAX protease family)
MEGAAPPGWYPDPWRQSWYRWWDGTQWTPAVHPPVAVAAPRVSPTFSPWGALIIALGTLVSIFAATLVGHLLEFRQHWEGVVVVYAVLFGSMTTWAALISRRLGTGHIASDFGLRLHLEDVGWGVVAFFAATVGRILVAAVLPRETRNPMNDVQRALQLDRAVLVAFSVAALVGAPIVEELVFRGVLQRSLTRVVGAPVAIGAQALVFAAYHFIPSTGRFTLVYFASLAVFGAVAGYAAERTGRLGPGMVAHFLTNVLAVIVLAVT